MPRYIDADALKAKYEQMIPEIGDGYHKETLQDVLFELDYAPTVSPDKVRGVGEWIMLENQSKEDTDNGNYWYTCSHCSAGDLHAKVQEAMCDIWECATNATDFCSCGERR